MLQIVFSCVIVSKVERQYSVTCWGLLEMLPLLFFHSSTFFVGHCILWEKTQLVVDGPVYSILGEFFHYITFHLASISTAWNHPFLEQRAHLIQPLIVKLQTMRQSKSLRRCTGEDFVFNCITQVMKMGVIYVI